MVPGRFRGHALHPSAGGQSETAMYDIRLLAARCDHHGDTIALEPRLLLHGELACQELPHLVEDSHPQFGPDNLTSPELHRHLRLVPFVKETPDGFHLELEVVLRYLGTYLHLLDIDGLPRGLLLAELVLVLAEIQKPADR